MMFLVIVKHSCSDLHCQIFLNRNAFPVNGFEFAVEPSHAWMPLTTDLGGPGCQLSWWCQLSGVNFPCGVNLPDLA